MSDGRSLSQQFAVAPNKPGAEEVVQDLLVNPDRRDGAELPSRQAPCR